MSPVPAGDRLASGTRRVCRFERFRPGRYRRAV